MDGWVVAWRGIYRVNDGGSRWRGAAESSRWTRDHGCAHISCVVWCRGDVDGRPDKVIALISPEDVVAEDGGGF